MKIVHLTPLYFNDRSCLGGAERYPVNLARGLVEASAGGCEVEIVSFSREAHRDVLQPGVTMRLLPAINSHESELAVLSWELPSIFAEADLVHIHQIAMRASETTLMLAKLHRKLVCATDHGSITSAEGVYPDRLELADRVICYSDYGASLLHTKTPIAINKGGVDADYFTPATTRVVRDRALFVGRLVPSKGVDRLITALPPDLPLTVCGRPYHREYVKLLHRLARGKQVRFIFGGNDAKVRDLYRRAWVTVLPSGYEDCYGNLCPAPELMGLTLLESMSCGTPVLCPRVGAMPEFVQDGQTGFVYESLPDLHDRLKYLARHPAIVDEMGQRGRRWVEETFGLRPVGARLLNIYRGLLDRRMEAAA